MIRDRDPIGQFFPDERRIRLVDLYDGEILG